MAIPRTTGAVVIGGGVVGCPEVRFSLESIRAFESFAGEFGIDPGDRRI